MGLYRKKWEQPSGTVLFQSTNAPSPLSSNRFDRNPYMAQAQFVDFSSGTPRSSRMPQTQMQPQSPMMSTQATVTMRTPSGTPSQAGLSQIAAISRMQQQAALRRNSPDRTSLTKRHVQDGQ
ncbi:hypothetical protein GCK32_020434, partial [Trichostrongylus colubriformis]